MNAQDLLHKAASHMVKRAEQYDQQDGERSVPALVKAFNAITGHELSDADGWLFLVLLKLVRAQTAKGEAAIDSAEDAVAYAALFGEAKLIGLRNSAAFNEMAARDIIKDALKDCYSSSTLGRGCSRGDCGALGGSAVCTGCAPL